ncbi:MAG TPA: alpha/beta hydrolase [Segeticoccus sp.]|uniref:alpha/beta fold hydrolase n=1 Tax=Segeticoccus sp. TaxID=2706531 RepID=UPI002D7E31BE|nr:alpha/beta hydrolase [Segeticoccus sp.]HET8599013.1 alpha/beta hydrolase [Segeticoccus sp.]
MPADVASVLVDGPWQHRLVSANGARFHVAELGEGPLVLLLHGFPQFWWAWRDQLPALADAGYRAAAMDLRGFGASDKPPRGYDTFTLAADAASVVRSLGASSAVVVGHGMGAWIAWSMPSMQPDVTRAIATLAMPHPLALRRAGAVLHPRQLRSHTRLAGLQRPSVPERQMTRDSRYVARLLRGWSAPGSGWPPGDVVQRYADAMALPFVAHSAAEYYRWVVRSQWRSDGRRFRNRLARTIGVPVLHVRGGVDRAVARGSGGGSDRFVSGPFEEHVLDGVGHFVHEEAPDAVNGLLLPWLDRLP